MNNQFLHGAIQKWFEDGKTDQRLQKIFIKRKFHFSDTNDRSSNWINIISVQRIR